MQDNQRPDITPQEMERNRKRLEVLTKDLKEIASNMTGIRQGGYTMPADGVTKAVKEARAKVKARARKPVESQPYSQPQVDCTQPHTVNFEGVIQSTNKVDKKHENIGIEEVLGIHKVVTKDKVITDLCLRWVNLAVEVGITESELRDALARSPGTLGDACRGLLQAKGY